MSSDVKFYIFPLTHTLDFRENIKYGRNGELERIEERRMESVLNVGGHQADTFISEVGLFK
jgi:hypothetical protein